MKVVQLLNEERIGKRADLAVYFDESDLTNATNAAGQTLSPFTILANKQGVECVELEIKEAFEDEADAAHNDTQVTIGDAGSANRLLTTTQINKNGTIVYLKPGTGTTYVPTADTIVTFTFASMTGKNLAALTKGKAVAYFRIRDARKEN